MDTDNSTPNPPDPTQDPKLALFLQAETLRMENNFEDAIPLYEQVLDLDPTDLGARKILAELYLIFGEREKGVRAYYELAQAHRRAGEDDKVVSLLKKIRVLDANASIDVTPKALEELAELEKDLEQTDRGEASPPSKPRLDEVAEVDLKAPLFGALPPDELKKLIKALRPARAKKGTTLFREGDLTRSLFIIAQGEVEIRARAHYASGPLGDDRPVAQLGQGEFFGEFSFLTGAPRSASARVVSEQEALLYVLPREAADDLAAEESLLHGELTRYYQERALDLLFARSALFAGLARSDRKRVAAMFTLRSMESGTTILEEGKSGDELYLIKKGEVEIQRTGSDGTQRLLAMLGPNQFFGEVSFLIGKPRSASAIAQSQVELLEISGTNLREIISHYPSVKLQLEKARLRRAVDTARRLGKSRG